MPEFKLNKLVRDNYLEIYERDNQQATTRQLTKTEHQSELIKKIVEEAGEINIDTPKEDITSEIADIFQVLDDFMKILEIDKTTVEKIQLEKLNKRGGFATGLFIDSLKLSDDDKWIEYYRQNPDLFPEK